MTWHSIMGKDAETMTHRPAQQLSIEEGPWEGGRLVITTQPGRIDITLAAMPVDPISHPTLGPFEEVSSIFESRLASVKMPTATRLAFGAVLSTFLSSPEQSGALLKTLVPEVSIAPGVTDVIFQSNRPRKLPKVSGIVLNRLSKWSQLIAQVIQYQNNQAVTKHNHLIQLEMDFNTHQDSALPGTSSYGSILTAMFSDARALVAG